MTREPRTILPPGIGTSDDVHRTTVYLRKDIEKLITLVGVELNMYKSEVINVAILEFIEKHKKKQLVKQMRKKKKK
jgi:hypothetical protein